LSRFQEEMIVQEDPI